MPFFTKYSILSVMLLVTNYDYASSPIPSLFDLTKSKIIKHFTRDVDEECKNRLPEYLYEDIKSCICGMYGKYVRCGCRELGVGRLTALTSDGKFVVIVDNDNLIRVFPTDVSNQTQSLILKQDIADGIIDAIIISLDSRYIITRTHLHTMHVWDIQTSTLVCRNSGFVHIPGSKFNVLTCILNNEMMLNLNFDFFSVSLRSCYGGIVLTQDGRYVVNVTNYQRVLIHEINTGGLRSLNSPNDDVPIISAAATSDGSYIIAGDCSKMIHIWNLETEQLIRSFSTFLTSPDRIAVTSDGQFIISCDNNGMYIWEFDTGELKQTIPEKFGNVRSISVTPDNRLISVLCNKYVYFFAITSYEQILHNMVPPSYNAITQVNTVDRQTNLLCQIL